MSFKAILYAYILGGLTFIPLLLLAACFYAIYTSVPVGDTDPDKLARAKLEEKSQAEEAENKEGEAPSAAAAATPELNDLPKPRKGWLTVRRTFEETASDGSYVGLVKGFLDARSKDPKRSRPKDMWYVALKGKVLYLYEDETMTECEAAIELSSYDVVIYPEGLLDGELFAKRNAVCLKPKSRMETEMPSLTKEMASTPDFTDKALEKGGSAKQKERDQERAQELEKRYQEAKQKALDPSTPWFIFVRSNVEMEDWYLALVHASDNPPNTSTLAPLQPVFQPADMMHLVETLDEQPDVIPMRWLNALIGRIFFSYYRTQTLESYIIGRLMRKLSKVKRPGFLTDVSVREVSVGSTAPTFSKPMLKELTKEGDASLEVHLHYKGEVRITVDATATINLGARFKSYTVKLVLAAVLREIEGNLLVKVKRPPSNRIWYAFTQMPRMVLDVEPVVSDRQLTWGMILSTIESRLKEVIQESVVLPNMDDIAFFESSKYQHRGGIWADASRHENTIPEVFPTTPEPSELDHPPASAPATDPSTPLATDVNPIELQRSHSAPIEPQEVSSGPELREAMLLPRATTISTSSASSTSSSTRRRTWFGGARDDGSTLPAAPQSEDETPDRGRSGMPDAATIIQRRSSSTPSGSNDLPQPDTDPRSEDESDTPLGVPIHRSLSQHSQSSSSTSQDVSNAPTSTNGPTESLLSSFRSRSPAQSSIKTLATSPTSNFFQTLKSRDKQAISNTAKEAMRKWGVNWGGLKKETPTSGDEAPDGDTKREENKVHKPRPSYAEVRAAVEQRRTSYNTEGQLLSANPQPSEPVTIPGRDKAPSTSSNSGAIPTARSVGNSSSRSTSPHSDRLAPELARQRSHSPSGSAPRQRTISHQSQPGHDGAFSAPVDEEEQPARPIYTQPPAPKAMTIPGIHASHRGEVMSMGYAPPPPPAPEQKKAPAIQSVYRLWKNPSQQSSSSQASADSSEHDQGESEPARDDTTPTPVTTPSVKPTPPPLPPRTISTQVSTQVQLTSEPPRHPPDLDRTSPPATAALQSIVSKDRSRRASGEPLPNPSGSPGRSKYQDDQAPPSDIPATDLSTHNLGQDVPKPKPPALPPRRAPASAPPAPA